MGIRDRAKLCSGRKLLSGHPAIAIGQAREITDGLPFGQRRIRIGVASGS